jgi:RHS repeat-associated protein
MKPVLSLLLSVGLLLSASPTDLFSPLTVTPSLSQVLEALPSGIPQSKRPVVFQDQEEKIPLPPLSLSNDIEGTPSNFSGASKGVSSNFSGASLEGRRDCTDRYKYDPFGSEEYSEEKAGFGEDTKRFTGHTYDPESGLIFTHGGPRPYDPVIGRWIAKDLLAGSIPIPQGLNRYVYVRNQPLTLIDPDGKVEDDPSDPSKSFGAYGTAGVGSGIGSSRGQIYRGGRWVNEAAGGSQLPKTPGKSFSDYFSGFIKSIANFFTGNKEADANKPNKPYAVPGSGVGKPFDPKGPKTQEGVDPTTLKPSKDLRSLNRDRLDKAEENAREQGVDARRSGELQDGNHRTRNAIDNDRSIDVNIVD